MVSNVCRIRGHVPVSEDYPNFSYEIGSGIVAHLCLRCDLPVQTTPLEDCSDTIREILLNPLVEAA